MHSHIYSHIQPYTTIYKTTQNSQNNYIYSHMQPYTQPYTAKSAIYGHVQPYTAIYNHIHPYTPIYSHIQLNKQHTAIYSHIQSIYSPLQPYTAISAIYNHIQPFTAICSRNAAATSRGMTLNHAKTMLNRTILAPVASKCLKSNNYQAVWHPSGVKVLKHR